MSYNPVRAANFYKTSRRRPKPNPHAGIKHSDIMRRKGVGAQLPQNRIPTSSGYSAELFDGDGFGLSHELLGVGNNSGIGVHAELDRAFFVTKGVLAVLTENAEGQQEYTKVPEGGHFIARAGVKHGFASFGNLECSFLLIEDGGYKDDWQQISDGSTASFDGVLDGNSAPEPAPYVLGSGKAPEAAQAVPSRRRSNQEKAKQQAMRQASTKVRRKPKHAAPAGQGAVAPTPAVMNQQGTPTITGAPRVGANASNNANSGNVDGISPMPTMGR